jgi:hypothetical protein
MNWSGAGNRARGYVPVRRVGAMVLGVLACGVLGGCYQKVVRASGPGASEYKIEESDRHNSLFGQWLDPNDNSKKP